METREPKQSYNSGISELASSAILRLSWALNCSMFQALDEIISFIPQPQINLKVCKACKDKSNCTTCIFYFRNDPKSALSTIIHGRRYDEYYND